nr:chorismate lyase [Pseudoalteromonas sp. MMG010]
MILLRWFLLYRVLVINFPVSISAQWHDAHCATTLSSREQEWLLEPHSLTAKLKAHACTFSVNVLNEQRFILTPQQQAMLKCESQYALNREVLLLCDEKPHVYAQSWLPDTANNNELHNMGERPLGDVIFQDPHLSRNNIEFAHFEKHHPMQKIVSQLNQPTRSLLGRRSVFSLQNYHFLVCEVFLPEAYLYT